MKRIFAVTIALGLIGTPLAAPLNAQEAVSVVEVQFGDLDVSRDSDMQRLRDRINRAVRRLCPRRIESHFVVHANPRLCREEAWQDAEQQLAALSLRTYAGETVPTTLAVTIDRETPFRN